MPVRWVINPVIETVEQAEEGGETFVRRVPKVATLFDPGRPGKRYQHSSAVGATHALSFVRGVDLSVLDADPECVSLFEDDVADRDGSTHLEKTPADLGWDADKVSRCLARITAKGTVTEQLRSTTPLRRYVSALGDILHPDSRAHLNRI